MKQNNLSISEICIVILMLVTLGGVSPISVSQDFTNALDAAVQELVSDPEWISYYSKTLYFNVPTCSSASVQWPKTNPFVGRSALNMCFETGAVTPWLETKTKVAETVVKKINNHYGTSYMTNILRYNTSALGFFDTMRMAVNSGECDMVTSNTVISTERTAYIHYQCPYGFGSHGWMRSGRDPQISLTDISQLNQTGIIIGANEGTSFATYVRTNLQAATFIPYSSLTAQFNAIKEQSVHAIVGDAFQYFYWANVQMGGNCNCTVRTHGTTFSLATFTNVNITATSGSESIFMNSFIVFIIMSILYLL